MNVLLPLPPDSSSALAMYTRSRFNGMPARLIAMNVISWMIPCPFMSSAPRPQTYPSLTSPANGSTDHDSRVTGTTSMWCTSAIAFPEPLPFSRA